MIGKKIRALRSKHRITQEQLAERLGITAQAVSRWESENCYPDIEMLPSIADFFNVTVDELLCIDHRERDAKINACIKQAHELQETLQMNGGFSGAIDILRRALREFPSSFLLHAELACAIGCIDNGIKIAKNLSEEALELCSRILDDCVDDNLRLRAKCIMCYIYAKQLDDAEKAQRIADTLPAQDRALVMAETLKIYPPSEAGNENIKNAIGHMLLLFGNDLGYQVEQHMNESINALIHELKNFKI